MEMNLFGEPVAAVVRSEDDQIVLSAKSALKRAGQASWEAADAFLELKRRGWTGRRIAEEMGVSESKVSRFMACARKFALPQTRPSFWTAYEEVDGHAAPKKRGNAQAGATSGGQRTVGGSSQTGRRDDGDLHASHEGASRVEQVASKDHAQITVPPADAPKDLDDPEDEVRAAVAPYFRQAREQLLQLRDEIGDDEYRAFIMIVLRFDGFSEEEVAAITTRMLTRHYPCYEDVVLVDGASSHFVEFHERINATPAEVAQVIASLQ